MKCLWIAGSLGLVLGCGGSNVAFVDDGGTTADSSASDDTAGGDAGSEAAPGDSIAPTDSTPPPDTAPPPPPTLDDVCVKLANGVCGKAAQTCCVKSGLGYDEAACRKNTLASCGANVSAAKAGTRTFHPDALSRCVDAWGKLETACTVNLLEFLRTYPPCQELFAGAVAPGAACTVDGDCAAPPGTFGGCSDNGGFPPSGKVCHQYTVVGKDAGCNFGGNVQKLCDLGLYCQYSTSTSGTCKEAKKIGDSCDAATWWSCGYGYVCQGSGFPPSPAKCVEGRPGGSSCGRDQDCASWKCTSYKCDPTAYPVATREICGGA